jgi:hypothetical protein
VRREVVDFCERETIVGRNGVGEEINGRKQVRFLLCELAFSLQVGSIGDERGVESNENFWVELCW